MLLSLILYGSRARGDHRLSSDVDLLGIIDGGAISKEIAARGASLYHYPFETLLDEAQSGDLFLLHLCREGKLLHDTAGAFERICEGFQFKKSYKSEVREASALIWYFMDRPNSISLRRVRKRLVWAIRTVLIARAAEDREAVFGARQLEEYFGLSGLKQVIDRRFTVGPSSLLELAAEVVKQHGASRRALGLTGSERVSADDMERFGPLAASAPRLVKVRKTPHVPYE